VPVNRTKHRPGRVVLTEFLDQPLSCLTEDLADRQTERAFDSAQCTTRQEVSIAAEIRAIEELVVDRDLFIKVEAADHPVDRAVATRRQANFLRECLDIGLVIVAPDQVG